MKKPLPFAITLDVGSSHANHTGSWRTERPIYVDRTPPCSNACPAGEDPRGWLYLAESGDYQAAWRSLVEVNPFPATMGRICYHPCETACNRAELDEAVGINAVERYLGDAAIENGWELPPAGDASGSSVLVVGAGPAGLSAAYHLRRLGHAVTIIEAATHLGGMLRYGIPAYRLPRDVLEAEIARIVSMGLDVRLGTPVEDLRAARDAGAFDAVFLAVGAQIGHRVEIPAGDSSRILDAVTLLRETSDASAPAIGRRVVIYGGGDTAVDAARTARRLGATDAVVIYRRDRAHMRAQPGELHSALEEGITTRWLSTVEEFSDGRIMIERMQLDAEGRPQPTGEHDELGADTLVLALGQESDLSLLRNVPSIRTADGLVLVDEHLRTSEPGIYAGGDVTPASRTATEAIGQGRRAAATIDASLRAVPTVENAPPVLATFEHLNTWYYADAPRQHRANLEAARRRDTFEEIVHGLDASDALFEARRCLSCGNCFQCDNCYGMCPDNAVLKVDAAHGYAIDYDFCKGCGICVQECPCGAIEMIPESI